LGFWAVGEIVKQRTGILESDGAAEAAGELDAAIAAVGLEEADAVLHDAALALDRTARTAVLEP